MVYIPKEDDGYRVVKDIQCPNCGVKSWYYSKGEVTSHYCFECHKEATL